MADVSLKDGEWSCYRGGQFNGGQHGHVTEVAILMEGEWSCYTLMGERRSLHSEGPI